MPQCPSGTQVAPGAPASFWAFDFAFLSYLSAKIPFFGQILATFFGPQLIVTADFCASEPVIPAAPNLGDYAGVLLASPGALDRVLSYWKANYLASVFPTYCQCVPGGFPAGSLEAWIVANYAPLNWWKYADVSSSTSALDSGTGGANAGMFTPYAFNTAKICPNATGTCLTTNGGGGNIGVGGASALNTRTQFSIAGFFQTTDTSHGALFGNYHSADPFIALEKDVVTGKLLAFLRDTTGTQVGVESTNADFHNGSTHLFVLTFDQVGGHWHLWSDNGRDECSGPLSNLSYWHAGAVMYLQDDFVRSLPYGGKSQDWFVTAQILTQADVQNLWFNAGLGGGPSFAPPATTTPTGAPSAPPVGPTAATPSDLVAILDQLEYKLDTLVASVTNHTSRSLGAVHPGLSGNGSFALMSALGVIVDVTAYRAGQGWTGDVPKRSIPKLGAIQFLYASKYSDELQVHYEHQQFMFPNNGVTDIAYTFGPGVTATITEITRGP